MKHLIQHRKQFQAFGRGTLEFLRPSNRKVLAFYRRYREETILVVANLSRFPQHVELDLVASQGLTPVEFFGGAEFPAIGEQPYLVTLGALGFFWFSLESKTASQDSILTTAQEASLPVLQVESFQEVFQGGSLAALLRLLPAFLKTRRWFQGRDRTIRSIEIRDALPIAATASQILLAQVEYAEGDPEIYVLPSSVAVGEAADQVRTKLPDVSVGRLRDPDGTEGILYSAIWDPAFADALLGAIARRRRIRGRAGELVGSHTRAFRKSWGPRHPQLEASVLKTEQTNTSIVFGNRFILKIYRRIEAGVHPEIEVSHFLTERAYPNIAPLTGSIEYRLQDGDVMSVAALHGFVQNQGDAWRYTLDSLSQFFAAALTKRETDHAGSARRRHPLELRNGQIPAHAHELIGAYSDAAQMMGRRTAELHLALSADETDPQFAPEPFTDHSRQAFYHSMMGLTKRTFQLLQQLEAQDEVQTLLEQQ
jgi:maltose alpha-D-glucosyltransferase/alpha-amylase